MGRRIIAKMILIIMTITLIGCQNQTKSEVKDAVAIEIETASIKEIVEVITLRGQLKPSKEFVIFVKTPGLKVTDISTQVGDEVKEGAYLFELDKTLVRKQVEQAKVNYNLAMENYNTKRLLNENSQKEIEDLQGKQQDFGLSVFRNIGKIPPQYQGILDLQMNQGQPSGGVNSQGIENSLMVATTQLEQARITYVNSIEQLEELEYFSPMDGVVSQINLLKNQIAMNNAPAMVISNIEDLKVSLSVSATLLKDLIKGQELKIRYGEEVVKGVISVINPVTDIRNNLHTVEVLINNRQKNFKPGGFVHVDLLRNHKNDAIVIPKVAIITEEGKNFVFIEKNGKAYRKKITTGITAGDEIEVVNGIKEGDRVIVKGQHFIEDLTPVAIRRNQDEDR